MVTVGALKFLRINPPYKVNASASLVGKAVVGTAAAGIAGHALVSAGKGRLYKHLVEGSQTKDVGKELGGTVKEWSEENSTLDHDMTDKEDSLSNMDKPTGKAVEKELSDTPVLDDDIKVNDEISQELVPSKAKIKKPKKLVTKKIRR